MRFLNSLCLNNPTKNPKEKRAGIVLKPKTSMTKAPYKALPELTAVMAKK